MYFTCSGFFILERKEDVVPILRIDNKRQSEVLASLLCFKGRETSGLETLSK